jgi:hypothetical protein
MIVDWKKSLKVDPTDWLLETDDPGVRYLALRDLVDADEKEIKEARTKAHRGGPIAVILDNMNPEGYWVKPGHVYSYKCRGTVWSIISLAQLGVSVEEDERVGIACSYLLDNSLANGGQFSPNGKPADTVSCLQGNLLTSLVDMGYQDSRLDAAYEWMARTVTGEGLPERVDINGLTAEEGSPGPFRDLKYIKAPLFACRGTNNLPCSWAGVKVMTAFSRLPIRRRSGLIERAINTGVEYFFSVDPTTAYYPYRDPYVPDPKWWKFGFPLFWVADILQIAEALTGLGYGSDPRLANTLALISSKQDENGRWPLELNHYRNRMWLNYGSRGKPNKWVTLRALKVLKQAEQQA